MSWLWRLRMIVSVVHVVLVWMAGLGGWNVGVVGVGSRLLRLGEVGDALGWVGVGVVLQLRGSWIEPKLSADAGLRLG